jgi:drug/metabolite transporter (DMT)-like permease
MAIALLTLVTLAYAGYNLFIKVSGSHAPAEASTTILATLCLQAGAVLAATTFFAFLALQGGHSFRLNTPTYLYAVAAGLCIGIAEVGYFYLFSGVAGIRPLAANVAIPTVVTGTIVITFAVAWLAFREALSLVQAGGALLVAMGIVLMFVGGRNAA